MKAVTSRAHLLDRCFLHISRRDSRHRPPGYRERTGGLVLVMTRSAKIARQTEYKDITGDITADQGLISGYLNTFHHVDFQQDRTLPGAFKKSLSEATARRAQQNLTSLYPLLFSHDFSQPVLGGVISANEDHHGLFVTCQMDMNSQRGREMFESCKNSFTSKFSMGFKCINSSYETDKYTGKTVRNLLECQLLEASLVTFPANDLSQITQVKGRQEYNSMLMRSKDFNSNYQQSQLSDWSDDFYDLTSALQASITDCFAAGRDPMAELESDVIPGFLAALRAYVQEGMSLGYSTAPSSAADVYMMSMAGAGQEGK